MTRTSAGGLEALSVVDPLGSLLSAGLSWLTEHVKPLSDALDRLAGNADLVGRLISWAAEVAFTLGLATPVVVAQASAARAR